MPIGIRVRLPHSHVISLFFNHSQEVFMATTNIHHPSPAEQRTYQRREERTSYAAVWIIVALAVLAAIAFGYYTSDPDTVDGVPMTRAEAVTTPTTDGTTSTMTGTSATTAPVNRNTLTPSVTGPGTPDTTTTESTRVPTQGVQ